MIRFRSKKTAKRDDLYKKICIEIDTERTVENTMYCDGCGRSDRPLSHSHLSNNPKFKCLKKNIRLHCFGSSNTCHELWETHGNSIKKIPNWTKEMELLKSIDNELYLKIFNKMWDRW